MAFRATTGEVMLADAQSI